MSKKDELLALADRVEAGSGVDDRLRRDVIAALGLAFADGREALTSIDAVEALRERLLPGSGICLSFDVGDDIWDVSLWLDEDRDFGASSASEPRGRLAAVLRAYAEGVE